TKKRSAVPIFRASTLTAAVILAAAIPACAGQAPTGRPSPAPPTAAVVHLAASYTPTNLRLNPGQQFLLIVSARIHASSPGGGGRLSPAVRPAASRLPPPRPPPRDRLPVSPHQPPLPAGHRLPPMGQRGPTETPHHLTARPQKSGSPPPGTRHAEPVDLPSAT